MALLGATFGGGNVYGNVQLNGATTYVGDVNITAGFNAILQFFSQSDTFVGEIRLDNDNSNLLLVEPEEEVVGGLKSFSFTIDKLPDFSFFNLMKVKIIIDGNHWYTGELLISSEPDERDPEKEFLGRGYIKYLDDIDDIEETYLNKTIKEIMVDLINTYILPNTPIEYDEDIINPPNITITKYEINNKSLRKVFDDLLEIANRNYNTEEYTFGINKDLFIYFEEISRNILSGYFEGYQFQNPKVKVRDNKVINYIDIYRSKENQTDELELVSTVQDSESQSRYGIRKSKITINDYVDTNTAERIAEAKLNKFKDAFTSVSLSDLEIDDRLPIGFYNISNRFQNYTKLINDCEDLADWDQTLTNATLTLDGDEYISGKNSLLLTANNAIDEFIEIDLDETVMYPDILKIYFKQNITGEYVNVTVFDEDGNTIQAGETMTYKILAEDGTFILNEEGGKILQETTEQFGIDIKIIEDWFLYKFDISAIDNIKKIRLQIITSTSFELNIDRVELETNSWFTRTLKLDKIKYSLNRTGIKADPEFGEKIDSIIDDIKKLSEKDSLILGIFQK